MKCACCASEWRGGCETDGAISDSCNKDNIGEIIDYALWPGGRKDSHQYRIPNEIMQKFKRSLIVSDHDVKSFKQFDEILAYVSSSAVKGIGELTVYDVALRIGTALNIYPDKVYLHAGTRVGAVRLGLLKENENKAYLTFEALPEWLQSIKPYQVEDFLCIYKEEPTPESLLEFKARLNQTGD